jgi:uncharacterized OB-fold protein
MRPQPRPSVHDGPYWRYAAAGELRLQRCAACGHVRYPPGPACPECLAAEHSWERLSGTGELLAWTVFHRPYFPDIPVPYVVLAVRTPEGPILIGNLAGAGRADGSVLRHGMAMRAVHEHVTGPDGGWQLCQWSPAESRPSTKECA